MEKTELRIDDTAIEPIPDADRDSTGPQQMWIWAGANIAPINWVLGALGIALKLGRKLTWNPAKEEFEGDKEANGHVAREQRKPWTYETV